MKTGIFRRSLAETERKKQVNKQTKAEGENKKNQEMENRENRTNINES